MTDPATPTRRPRSQRETQDRHELLPAVETWFAFVHEGLSGFVMILGEPGVHVVGHFQVHALAQLAG